MSTAIIDKPAAANAPVFNERGLMDPAERRARLLRGVV